MLASVLSSCSMVTLDVVQVDQLMPASLSFPNTIKKVGVVDRLHITQADQKNNPLAYDTSLFAELVGEQLAEADYFDDVVLCDSNVSYLDRQDSLFYPLSQEHVQDLTNDLGVDMLVTIDGAQAKVINTMMQLWVQVEGRAKVYVPSRSNSLLNIVVKDTLTWDNVSYLSVDDLRNDAMTYTGEKIVQRLAPYWQSVDRYYYNGGNAALRDGATFAKKGDWEQASTIWQNALTGTKGTLHQQLQFNLAVAKEMQGDVEGALSDCQQLQKTVPTTSELYLVTTHYVKNLTDRAEKMQRLDLQMKRFN